MSSLDICKVLFVIAFTVDIFLSQYLWNKRREEGDDILITVIKIVELVLLIRLLAGGVFR